ncbi:MAG: hypothetical protein AAB817_01840 [Patescibacteria group bacterium]
MTQNYGQGDKSKVFWLVLAIAVLAAIVAFIRYSQAVAPFLAVLAFTGVAVALWREVRTYRMRPATAAIIGVLLVIGGLGIKAYCPNFWSAITTGDPTPKPAEAAANQGPAKYLFAAQPPTPHEIGPLDCGPFKKCNTDKPLPANVPVKWFTGNGTWTIIGPNGQDSGYWGKTGQAWQGEIPGHLTAGSQTTIGGGEGGVEGLTFTYEEPAPSIRQLNPQWVTWCVTNKCGDADATTAPAAS